VGVVRNGGPRTRAAIAAVSAPVLLYIAFALFVILVLGWD